MNQRDYAREIAAATKASDVEALTALAIELTGQLSATRATLDEARSLEEKRREDQANRKRRQRQRDVAPEVTVSRDVTGQSVTSRDVPGQSVTSRPDPSPPPPSSSFPTPHITPSTPAPPRSTNTTAAEASENSDGDGTAESADTPPRLSRATLLGRIRTLPCKAQVGSFLDAVPSTQNEAYWVEQIAGWLEGLNMPRLQPPEEQDIAAGLAEYSRLRDRDYSPAHVRTFVVRAKADRIRLAERENPGLATGNKTLTREARRARDEREEAQQQELRIKWMGVEGRRAQRDGEEWWTRMKQEAAAAGEHPIAYAYSRVNEPRASATSGVHAA